ncbi:MAG: hypothetical protein KGI27_02230 [Thaumarchaeota archaeon]|nr:hypothetical protein [Nitrososphaerota archaeon]
MNPLPVSDFGSNRNDNIMNAVESIGKSKDRLQVFQAICKGKQKIKTASWIFQNVHLKTKKRVLEEAKNLVHDGVISQLDEKIDGDTAYQKINFYCKNRNKIIRLIKNPVEQTSYPTKTNPKTRTIIVDRKNRFFNIREISIDDIGSFARIKKIHKVKLINPYEKDVKQLLKKILDEDGKFSDWGGETDDLFTTRLKINGKRVHASLGLKGKATRGPLTPKKMGKNGDQIQRLFRNPAQTFIVQFNGEIDSSIIEQLKEFSIAKSAKENRIIYFGIIDGKDTSKLFLAYS